MHGFQHRQAAEEIYKNIERINAEADYAGTVAQDTDEARDRWVQIVADFIAAHDGVRQATCWHEEWRPE